METLKRRTVYAFPCSGNAYTSSAFSKDIITLEERKGQLKL